MSATHYTTISLKPENAKALQLYKTGGKTWDDVVREFMDHVPPEEFLKWAAEELKRPGIPLSEFKRRHRLK
ncbi:MAG: hypothetical protein KGJ23_13165 [Euryarchaeota archaeon]|nr:hypothetical protein [Euryarchaeota archaeon]MDE1837550.1 hypothetical protein [Euryarchaeota archaeon]MDE1880031.1 hypothetical protein [Euryarchaeota archaeon]MDE2046140.1 hypothetical protein [Thermoplasmata archaeon]